MHAQSCFRKHFILLVAVEFHDYQNEKKEEYVGRNERSFPSAMLPFLCRECGALKLLLEGGRGGAGRGLHIAGASDNAALLLLASLALRLTSTLLNALPVHSVAPLRFC